MATDLDASISKLEVEERLFAGVMTTGGPSQYEGLLATLEDVDVRGSGDQTLLHAAVRAGKVDWVERLLDMGADPGLVDLRGSTAVALAEDKWRANPGEGGRWRVLRLVQMAHQNDGARRGARGTPGGDLDVVVGGGKGGPTSIPEGDGKGSRSLKDCVEELNGNVQRLTGELEELKDSGAEWLKITIMHVGVRLRFDCVHAMMENTKVLKGDSRKEAWVRGLYERIYSASPLTSCLLAFLQFQTKVKIKVDCETQGGMLRDDDDDGAPKLWRHRRTLAGSERLTVYLGWRPRGPQGDETAAGVLSAALAQLSVRLSFGNGGRPHYPADEANKRRWRGVTEEAKRKATGEGAGLDPSILYAWKEQSQLAREVALMSVVPWMLARYGATDGAARLQVQLPSLLAYYEEVVMPALVN